jgi:hypothetical protein
VQPQRSPDTNLTAQVKATAFRVLGRQRFAAANEPVTEIAAPSWPDTILHRASNGSPTVRMEAWRQVASVDAGTPSTASHWWRSITHLLLALVECLRRIYGSWGAPRPRHLEAGKSGGAFARQSCYGRSLLQLTAEILRRPIWGVNSPQPPPRRLTLHFATYPARQRSDCLCLLLKSRTTLPRAPARKNVKPP